MYSGTTTNRLTIKNNVFSPNPINLHKAFVCCLYVSESISFTCLKMEKKDCLKIISISNLEINNWNYPSEKQLPNAKKNP
jgi:hypothetical protein